MIGVISDLLLLAAALGAGGYCLILSKRLTRLSSIDKGLGGAIAVLSAQVDDMTKVLAEARGASEASAERLSSLMKKAEVLSADLEMMLGACDDLPRSVYEQDASASSIATDGNAYPHQIPGEQQAAVELADSTEDLAFPSTSETEVAFGSRRSRDDSIAPVFRRRAVTQEAAE